MRTKSPKRILIYLTFIVAAIDLSFVALNYYFAKQSFHRSLLAEAETIHAGFETLLSQQEQTMLSIATFIANDHRVRNTFQTGVKTVVREGGGKGGVEAQAHREELLSMLQGQWQSVQEQFSARQLHFHFGPEATSFLRIHKPNKYGDNLHEIRHTITHAHNKQINTSGFETGRVYSGIRGVVPIFNSLEHERADKVIGTVEVGTSFINMLQVIDERYNVGGAVFLTKDHVDKNMWPDAVKERMGEKPVKCDCYLEATTRKNITGIIEKTRDEIRFRDPGADLIELNGNHLALAHFPIYDFLSRQMQEPKPVGAVVFWSNANERVAAFRQDISYSILYAIIAFLFIEAAIVFAFRFATNSLQRAVTDRTRELNIANNELTALNENLEIFEAVFRYAGEGIMITNFKGEIVDCNSAVCKITGYQKEELLGKNPNILSSGRQDPEFYREMWSQLLSVGNWTGEIWNRKKDGSIYAEALHISAIKDRNDNILQFAAIFSDITRKKEESERNKRAALYDALTSLPNRTLLMDRITGMVAEAKRSGRRFACAFIDLDGFKEVNDQFGHEAGDTVLIEFADRISQKTRETDTLARLGGDEFVILISDVGDIEILQIFLNRVLSEANRAFSFRENLLSVSASIGVHVVSTDSELDAEGILSHADHAMYQSKRAGKNRITINFDSSAHPVSYD